jgi:hypothetical protein
MSMETFSMADCDWLTSQQSKFNNKEAYLKRLVRVDLGTSISRDPLRSKVHVWLRALRFYRHRDQPQEPELPTSFKNAIALEAKKPKSYQNTTLLADILARFVVALVAGVFLVIPLVMLHYQSNPKSHLLTVTISIIIFSLIVSLGSKASNQETLVAAAGYAAVLAVFVSSTNNPSPT